MKLSEISYEKFMSMTPGQKWDFNCGGIRDEGKKADAAILLGGRPVRAIRRAEAAAALYHAGRVKYIVPSGGVKWKHNGEEISEADLMTDVLVKHGVPKNVILPDNEARTTKENMICSTLVLNRRIGFENMDSVIIVTSHMHMKRSLALARALLPRKLEISAYPSYLDEDKEEWIAEDANLEWLDTNISLLKRLADDRIIEDMELDVKKAKGGKAEMEKMLEVYFVRHGQSEANRQNVEAGWSDTPLSALGRQQAMKAAGLFEGIRLDKIYSSDLVRAVETCRLVLPGCEPELCAELREISVGRITGIANAKARTENPQALEYARKYQDYSYYGGETNAQVRERIRHFVEGKLNRLPAGTSVAVFGHVGTILHMLGYVLEQEVLREKLRIDNAAVFKFARRADGRWQIVCWNCTGGIDL